MPAAKKRQSRLAGHKRPIIIGALTLCVAVLAYGVYIGIDLYRMTQLQVSVLNTARYQAIVFESIESLRYAPAVDFTTGRRSIPSARLILPASPAIAVKYGYDMPDDQTPTRILLSSDGAILQARTSADFGGPDVYEQQAAVSETIDQAQACRRQVVISFDGSRPDAKKADVYEQLSMLKLRDGRTATLFRNTDCRANADDLITLAKGITSF